MRLQTLAFELLTRSGAGVGRGADGAGRAGWRRPRASTGWCWGRRWTSRPKPRAAPLTLDEITALQAGKTGALIGFAAEAGAVIAGADRAPLRRYAAALGLAFQIADDILDVTGDEAKAGKRLRQGRGGGQGHLRLAAGAGRGEGAGGGRWWPRPRRRLPPMARAAANLIAAARFVIARDS